MHYWMDGYDAAEKAKEEASKAPKVA